MVQGLSVKISGFVMRKFQSTSTTRQVSAPVHRSYEAGTLNENRVFLGMEDRVRSITLTVLLYPLKRLLSSRTFVMHGQFYLSLNFLRAWT